MRCQGREMERQKRDADGKLAVVGRDSGNSKGRRMPN